MSILMGIMAVLMVIAVVSGRGHMMGGHEKAQQQEEATAHDAEKHACDDCPVVNEDGFKQNKTDAEVTR